jgi:hypothetical protein
MAVFAESQSSNLSVLDLAVMSCIIRRVLHELGRLFRRFVTGRFPVVLLSRVFGSFGAQNH